MNRAAYFADMSDPERNPQFRRLWVERLDPVALDRRADVELAHGHVAAAEYLARRAEALREAAE